jgi:hypothetical protein
VRPQPQSGYIYYIDIVQYRSGTAIRHRHCSTQKPADHWSWVSVIPYHLIFDLFVFFFTFTIYLGEMSPTSYTDIVFFYDLKIPFAIWIGFFIGRRIIFMRPRLRSGSARVILTCVRVCHHFAATYSLLNALVRF